MPAFELITEGGLLLSRDGLRRLCAFKDGMSARVLLHKDRKADGGQHEDDCAPCSETRQQISCSARAKSRLRTLTAECAGEISTFALLKQHDDNQENTDDDVENNQ
jgi:hypothetical protein